MSASSRLSATGTKVALRGYERMMTMADNGSMKIVTTMVVRSPSDNVLREFVRRLPNAVVSTFNKHPRMRARQLRDEFATAQIQPPVTLDSVWNDQLLEVRAIADDDAGDTYWQKYAEVQSNIPIDRFTQLPYYVRVLQYPSTPTEQPYVRLMLFADHYMSDGISVLTVLHDIMRFASEGPRGEAQAGEELPLRPSLYDMWMGPHKWSHPLRRWLVRTFGVQIFKNELKKFVPAIPVRADQAAFALPPTVNSSSALFGIGTPENMHAVMKRCKKEGVTFFGVFAASVVTAFSIARDTEGSSPATPRDPFSLSVEVDFNMRQRMPNPAEETPVGTYLATTNLGSLAKKGVRMDDVCFWDLARNLKHELDDALESFFMPLPLLFLDLNLHSQVKSSLINKVPLPYGITSDVNISNIGRYPYPRIHELQTGDAEDSGDKATRELLVDSVHVYNSNPNLGAASIVYVTSTDKFNFSMMHKFNDKQARALFNALVTCIENSGTIDKKATMAEVTNQVKSLIEERAA